MPSNGPPTAEIVSYIEGLPRLSEAVEVRTFVAFIENDGGGQTEVMIELRDTGQPAGLGPGRYQVVARDDLGNATSGNAADTVQTALSIVHWQGLGVGANK